MARPQSVSGGRPVTVSVRLSQQEADALDRVRGPMKRGDYLRHLIPRSASTSAVVEMPDAYAHNPEVPNATPIVVESPLTEEPIAEPPTHRHRRGKVIGEWREKGTLKQKYRCAVDGCTHEMRD